MTSVVKFIYTGDLDVDEYELVKEVCMAADYYQLPRLKCLCKSAIVSAMTINNVISTLVFADSFGPGMEDLTKNAFAMINQNPADMANAGELLNLSGSVPKHIISLVFKALANTGLYK